MIEIETPFFQEAGEPVHQPRLLWHKQFRHPRLPDMGQYKYFKFQLQIQIWILSTAQVE